MLIVATLTNYINSLAELLHSKTVVYDTEILQIIIEIDELLLDFQQEIEDQNFTTSEVKS